MTAPSPDQLLAAHEDASVGMAVVSLQADDLGRTVATNRALSEMLGDRAQLELDADQLRRLAAGEIASFAVEMALAGAEVRWVRLHLSVVREPLYAIAQVIDITPLKRVAEQLAAVVDTALDAIITADDQGTILEFNPAAQRLFGLSESEAVGGSLDLIVPGEDRPLLARLFRGESDELFGRRLEARGLDAHGDEFPVELAITRSRDDPPVFTGFVRDLRETHAARQALEESEQRYRRIVETTSEGIWTIDADARTTFVNRRGAEILGYAPEELVGVSPLDLMDASERDRAAAALERRRRGVEEQYRITFRHRHGHPIHVSLSAVPLVDDDGSYAGSLALLIDVTERVQAERERAELEARLHQAQRLETVGRLAGGVAHDFNNLLSVIEGYADFVAGEVPDRPDAIEGIEEIRRAAERAAALTRQLLTFSRRDLASPETVDLRDVVGDVRSLLGRTLGTHIELAVELPDEPARATVDIHQFEQVLLNLAVNARDAMPDGGRLGLELKPPADGRIELTVSDTGTGMSEAVAARAFEPFFTTKPPGEGSGLGLATVYGIVTHADGDVRLESAPGEGTQVRVVLPEAAEGAPTGAPGAVSPARGQTVLLVDDEEAVRSMAAHILRRNGYEVVEAAGAEQALATFRALERLPDLVLTDVAMPRMSGVELAARLGKSSPPVVFMSGYTDESVDNPRLLSHSAGFLQKPFSASALLNRVAEALVGGRDASV